MAREKITFHTSWLTAVKALPKEMQGEALLALLDYATEGSCDIDNGLISAIVIMAKSQIDADNTRYENGCKGGAPRKNSNAQKTTENNRKQPNDNRKQPKTTENNRSAESVDLGGTIGGTSTTTIRENKLNNNYKTDDVEVDDLCAHLRAETTWVEAVCMNLHKDPAYIQQRIEEFCTEQKVQGVTTKSLGDAKRHFRSWLRKVEQIEAEQSRRGEPTTNGRLYHIFTYDEMVAEIHRKGGSTNDYATLYMGDHPKPMWVRIADKMRFNIPDKIAS